MSGNINDDEMGVLQALLDDPTRSLRDLAKALNSYRQKIWRTKSKMEKEKVIWGYSAIIDESRLGHVLYVMLMKMRPMDQDLAQIIIKRVLKQGKTQRDVRLENILYVNGEYDWMVMFSAQDHMTARRYYDSIRIEYDRYLLEKPSIIDVNFCLVRGGKANPDMQRLYEFIPRISDTGNAR